VHTRFHTDCIVLETPGACQEGVSAHDGRTRRIILRGLQRGCRVRPTRRSGLGFYRGIDRAVFAELEPFADRLWEFPGLGRQSAPLSFSAS
jgi:hypothetical protein